MVRKSVSLTEDNNEYISTISKQMNLTYSTALNQIIRRSRGEKTVLEDE